MTMHEKSTPEILIKSHQFDSNLNLPSCLIRDYYLATIFVRDCESTVRYNYGINISFHVCALADKA